MAGPGDSADYQASMRPLLELASELVRVLTHSRNWEHEAQRVIQELGATLNASRCSIIELHMGKNQQPELRWRLEWSDVHTESLRAEQRFVPIPATDREAVYLFLDSPQSSSALGLNDVPPSLQALLSEWGVQSASACPIDVEGRIWGWLAVEAHDAPREWTDDERSALTIVASALGMAIERQSTNTYEARFSAMFENSEDAIISKTLDGTVTQWNKAAERIYGYSADEMIGDSITRIIPDTHIDEFYDIMRRLQAGQRIEHLQTRRARKDGTELVISLSISPVYGQAGAIAGALSIGRDITRQKQAELELRASEQRLKLALESGNIGAWDWDIRTNKVIWSPNMELLHGQQPGTFDGTVEGFRAGIHLDDQDRVFEAIERALAGDEEYRLEYRSLRSDGSYQWLLANGSVIRDMDGAPLRMTGVCYDVTARKRAESAQLELLAQVQRARAESDAEVLRLRELFQNAPAMMTLLEGPEHVFVLANEHYSAAVGHRDILNKPIVEALPEIKDQGLVELLDTVYHNGETITRSELPVLVDLGGNGELEQRYFSFAYQPFRDAEGSITGVLVHAVDLTDHVRSRQRVEQLANAVATERDRLQQVIDVMPEGVAICDVTGRITLSNAAAQAIWGQLPPTGGFDDYVRLNPFTLDLQPYPVNELPLARSVYEGEIVLGEQMIIRHASTGENVDVLVNSAPLRDSAGEIVGGVAVFQDIRPLKELERHKDEFLQAITHDLKNPLTAIMGSIQFVQRGEVPSPERLEAVTANMESAARRAIVLVDEILDLTRLQMGRPLEMTSSSVDLIDLARQIADQHQSMTERHQILVESEVEESTGEWDRSRLERVLANLVSNAVNYSPEGGTVIVRVRQELADTGSMAVVEVQDEGLGIPVHEMPRLFERFWRGSNVRHQVPGTGLGLAGAKAIVEAHGGEIIVRSIEGEGSTFTIRLPRIVPMPAGS